MHLEFGIRFFYGGNLKCEKLQIIKSLLGRRRRDEYRYYIYKNLEKREILFFHTDEDVFHLAISI